MRVKVTKKFSFEACHYLPNHKGLCHNLHGHSYEGEITLSGNICKDASSEEYGMITDFKKIKKLVDDLVISKLDHSYLNDTFKNPTAENMAIAIFRAVEEIVSEGKFFREGVTLESVKLWETRDSYAEVTRE